MGTLDPMATGVLPILLGSAAKFQIYAPENIKEYICEIQFGTETDTWDIWGKIINQTNSNIKINNLENILEPSFEYRLFQQHFFQIKLIF